MTRETYFDRAGVEHYVDTHEPVGEIDPELVDDRETHDEDVAVAFDLPDYDPEQFELPDDFEYTEEGDDDGSSG